MSSDEEEQRDNEQVRVRFRLSADCQNESLEVPDTEMALPSNLGRKGLSTVVNHLLDRRLPNEEEENDDDDDERPEALPFDFLVGESNTHRLLRTSLEREARQNGLSLEDALVVTYFPAQPAPQTQGSPPPMLPDWVSELSYCDKGLTVASYDGSLRRYMVGPGGDLSAVQVASHAHTGPIHCLTSFKHTLDTTWTISGAMNHSLAVHTWSPSQGASCVARALHDAAVVSLDERITTDDMMFATGDWDGGVTVWSIQSAEDGHDEHDETKTKKRKTSYQDNQEDASMTQKYALTNKISLQAHQTKVSGVCWGNHAKRNGFKDFNLITGSWDHSIKVWDMERQDCLLTLNCGKVVTSMDTSYFTPGIVATARPDCLVRLWDVRIDQTTTSNSLVSDSMLRPSHRAWVSQVKWSSRNPYQLFSASHDGSVKVWDIRAAFPLHTVRVVPKDEKVLSIALASMEEDAILFAGGTDCEVKQYILDGKDE